MRTSAAIDSPTRWASSGVANEVIAKMPAEIDTATVST